MIAQTVHLGRMKHLANHTGGKNYTHRDDQVTIHLLLSLFQTSEVSAAVQKSANQCKHLVWSVLQANPRDGQECWIPNAHIKLLKPCIETLLHQCSTTLHQTTNLTHVVSWNLTLLVMKCVNHSLMKSLS